MEPLPDERIVKRRKVRKGTHSCWECRKRKVKCLFNSSEDNICDNCARRGTTCVEQGIQLAADECTGQPPHVERRVNIVKHTDPVAGLPPTPASDHTSELHEASHLQKIQRALIQAIPCSNDIKLLMERLKTISMLAYESYYKNWNLSEEDAGRIPNSHRTLLHPETHPVLLARQMLLFAAAMRYLSPNDNIIGLTKHYTLIAEDLIDAAVQYVSRNDVLVGSLEHLQTIVLETFYHIDSGNIRRAWWMTMHRAVMVAKLLGLHSSNHYRYKLLASDSGLLPQSLWLCILAMDRTLSLLLGLPPASSSAYAVTINPIEVIEPEYRFRVLCTNIAAKILDRNQLIDYDTGLALTQEIDRDLIEVTESTPPEFWRPLTLTGLQPESMGAFHEVQRAWDHMCYHYIAIQLHLRFILCPSKGSQYLYSRIACVNASREILNRQIAIRSSHVITASCRLGDFIALIAGMTLVLAHIVSHYPGEETINILTHQRISDRVVVESSLKTLETMSELRDDLLGAKCAALLTDLLVVEAETAKYQAQLRTTTGSTGHELQDCKMLTIRVPYMGDIQLSAAGLTATPVSKIQHQDHNLPDGVMVGGIGSLHVGDTTPNLEGQREQLPCLHVPAEQQMSAPMMDSGQADNFFPDALAPIDQWVFQGADTAFFDSLLQGAGDQWMNHEGMFLHLTSSDLQ